MSLLHPTKRDKERAQDAESVMRPAGMRQLLMVCLLVGVFFLYSWNFERKLEDIEAKSTLYDEKKILTKDERRQVGRSVAEFKRLWGIDAQVSIFENAIRQPTLHGTGLFIGIRPAVREKNFQAAQAQIIAAGLLAPLLKDTAPLERELELCLEIAEPVSCINESFAAVSKILAETKAISHDENTKDTL